VSASHQVKPARWAACGPRLQDNHLLQGCLALFPLWDGGGPDAVELMRHAGAAYHAQWEVAPSWGVGRAGFCTVHDGTDTGGLNVTGSFTAFSKLKQPLPLTIEALIEPFAANPAEQGTIFCNDGTRSTRYRGIVLTQTAAGALQLSYGDGTGQSSTDRRTFTGPSSFTQANTLYHVFATARGPTDGEIWVNGTKLSITTSGSGGTIAYGSDPARIGSQGGFSVFSTGFNGRIYMVALHRRSFTPLEIQQRTRDPYRFLRRPTATALVAKGSAPPPVGQSGKGSIVIAIAC
jgi:hypothetical protein